MRQITKDAVHTEHDKTPRKKCFHNNSGVQKKKEKPTFSVSIESAKKIFEHQTGISLRYNPNYDNYWKYINEAEITKIEVWEQAQGDLIFLRNCLSLSIALDSNLIDNTSGKYTQMGNLENQGKNNRDQNAINQLADVVAQKITALPFYKDADLICSVPSHPDKDFDLPSSVTSLVSTKIGKQDVTHGFIFDGQKSSVRTSTFDEKWDVWEKAQLSFQNSPESNVDGKIIVLIDDKYQSGITIQYVAMKLQEAGAHEVYGLSFVKTLRDTDNIDDE